MQEATMILSNEDILSYFDAKDIKDIQRYTFEAMLQEGKNKRLSGRSIRRYVMKRIDKRVKKEMLRLTAKNNI